MKRKRDPVAVPYGTVPVADVLNMLGNGGVGADPVPIHQGDQFTFLQTKRKLGAGEGETNTANLQKKIGIQNTVSTYGTVQLW